MKPLVHGCSTLAALLMLTTGAIAQPKVVGTGVNNSWLAPDGLSAAGLYYRGILTYGLDEYYGWKYTIGGSAVQMGNRMLYGEAVRLAGNGQTGLSLIYNEENWAGFDTGSSFFPPHGHTLAGLWTSPSTWTNPGSFPSVGGQGAAVCDNMINDPTDISGNGRFIVGSCHYAAFDATDCKYKPFVYDITLNSWTLIPYKNTGIQPGAIPFQVSSDGKVVCGYDNQQAPNPAVGILPSIQNPRAIAVWERTDVTQPFPSTSETILDPWPDNSSAIGKMNRPGTVIAAPLSSTAAQYLVGDSSKAGQLVRYVKNTTTGAWDRVIVGPVYSNPTTPSPNSGAMTATGVSADGNTIVGHYGGGDFIWKPSLNGGHPMNLQTYLASLNGGHPFPSPNYPVSIQGEMSDDGNAVLVSIADNHNNCTNGQASVLATGASGILYFDGSQVPCQAPVITAISPSHTVDAFYASFGEPLNMLVSGSWPMTFQWQIESPTGSGNWTNLQNDCGLYLDTNQGAWIETLPFNYEGTDFLQLRIGKASEAGNYRVIATNACGSATSNAAYVQFHYGACCHRTPYFTDTICEIMSQTDCEGDFAVGWNNGVFMGDATTCSPSAPCASVLGACCYDTGICTLDVQPSCTKTSVAQGGHNGIFAGNGTTCDASPCTAYFGACCYSASSAPLTCTIEFQNRCLASSTLTVQPGLGGIYTANGAACGPSATCPAGTAGIGACCYSNPATADIACAIQTSAHCTAISGVAGGLQGKYLGDGITCGASSCNPTTFNQIGACCFTDPANSASGPMCSVQYYNNCTNYPNGSDDLNTAPFNYGLGGNFYTNKTCSTAPDCNTTAGACFHTPYDNSTPAVCTVQVRASRCTRPYNGGGLFGTFVAGAMCSPDTMAQNTGACCYLPTDFDGNQTGCVVCTIQPQARCINPEILNGGLSGVYGGNGTVCSPIPQCPAQYGACCTGNTCAVVARSTCTGTLFGVDSTSCEPVSCGSFGINSQPPPTGACCDTTTLGCTVTIHTACASNHAWLIAASCSPSNPCAAPASGACCLGLGSCAPTCSYDCANNGGAYQGDSTTCQPSSCLPSGICCRGATCSTTTSDQCTVASGTAGAIFVGPGSSCGASASSPCCYADYNKLNGVTVQDIFSYLADWFAGSPYAKVGGDGTPGPVTVQNIFSFLSAWFAGGC